jgi:hypothetical protein
MGSQVGDDVLPSESHGFREFDEWKASRAHPLINGAGRYAQAVSDFALGEHFVRMNRGK